MNDMQNMEKVIAIYELLGGKNEPQIQDLVTLYRKWVRTEELLLREAPFSASPKVPHLLFVFRDLLLIGKPPKSSLPDGRKSMVLNMFSSSRTINSDAGGTQTTSSNELVKLTHSFPLAECTFKSLPSIEANAFALQLTRVCRVKQLCADGKSMQTLTKVEKVEFWFSTLEQRDTLLEDIQLAMSQNSEDEDDSIDEEDGNFGDEAAQAGGDPPVRHRAWARNRMKRANSEDSSLSNTNTANDMNPLSLDDLALRYNVDFAQPLEMKNVEEFTVEFGEGQMGFSLSSGPEVGVVVGKLSPQGFAQLGGCEIGDRLDTINGIQVDMDTTWQRAVEMIKACGRPVTLKFVRNIALMAQVQQATTETTDATVVTLPSSNTPGQRKWATRKQGGNNANENGLKHLEKMYKSLDTGRDGESGSVVDGGDDYEDDTASQATPSPSVRPTEALFALEDFAARCEDNSEKACVAVLTEIYQTEKEFVSALRGLIKEYVLPLRRATKRRKCRELDTSALMCEHGSLKSKCSKTSSVSGPMLSTEDIKQVFLNLETIVKVNAELLNSIELGLMQASDSLAVVSVDDGLMQVVEIFSLNFDKIKPFFSMYALYCHQYPVAARRLQQLRNEDEDVDALLRDREAKSKQTSLRSLLIKPVQRICRYPLLFQELLKRARALKHCRAELLHHIEQTAEDADRIAQDVNKAVESREAAGSIMHVYQELGGEQASEERVRNQLLVPSRRFIRSEEVFFREAPFDTEIEQRRMYLFNDLVIFAQHREPATSSVRNSLSAKRPLSLKKSISNLLSFSQQTQQQPEDKPLMQAATATSVYEVTNWIELNSAAEVKPLPKPDDMGYYGFRLKAVKRTTVHENVVKLSDTAATTTAPAAITKKVSWGPNVAVNSNTGGGVTKVVTSIKKMEVWMNSRDKLQVLIASIEDQIVTLDTLQQNAKLGAEVFGGRQKARSWIKKKNSGEDLGSLSRKSMSNSVDGSKVDTKDVLAQLQKKYSSKNMSVARTAAEGQV